MKEWMNSFVAQLTDWFGELHHLLPTVFSVEHIFASFQLQNACQVMFLRNKSVHLTADRYHRVATIFKGKLIFAVIKNWFISPADFSGVSHIKGNQDKTDETFVQLLLQVMNNRVANYP